MVRHTEQRPAVLRGLIEATYEMKLVQTLLR